MALVKSHGEEWATLSRSELAQKYEEYLAGGRA
jgi:hypothetical protein